MKTYFDKFLKIFGFDSGRKYALVVLVIMITSLFVYIDVIPDIIYRDIVLGVVLTYIGGNVTQSVFAMTKDKTNEN